MNTAAKYLLRDYWWELETKEIKWCIGSKRVMPSLCIHILFALFHLFDFSFSTLHFIIHSIRTATVKNKCCVFLVSTLNGFCFIGNAVSVSSNNYQLRHISNPVIIDDGVFWKNWQCFLAVDFFVTKAIGLVFVRLWNLPLILIQWLFLPRILFQNCSCW